MMPQFNVIRDNVGVDYYAPRAWLHIPPLEELSGCRRMTGKARCSQFVNGSPTLGVLAEPEVYPVCPGAANPNSWGEVFENGPRCGRIEAVESCFGSIS